MSSRFGPSLPPHMKRSQYSDYANEEKSRKSHTSSMQSKSEGSRDRHRYKYRERGREASGKRRSKDERDYRNRNSKQKSECSKKYKNTDEKHGSVHEGSRSDPKTQKICRRSRSDRTYNTDTEESSDDHEEVSQWMKQDKARSSEKSSSDDSESEIPSTANPDLQDSSRKLVENLKTPPEKSCNQHFMGPALPASLINEPSTSTCRLDFAASEVENYPSGSEQKNIEDSSSNGGGQINPSDLHLAEVDVPIGPALPQNLLKAHASKSLEPVAIIGPVLQSLMEQSETSSSNLKLEKNNEDFSSSYKSDEQPDIGPALPPGFRNEDESRCSESGEEDVVGPLLPSEILGSSKNFMVQSQLERNAAAVKEKMEGKVTDFTKAIKREEWMVELPPEGSLELGLGPRSFRIRGAPEKGADRSAWTDTPADKARKEEEAKHMLELGVLSSSSEHKKPTSTELLNRDRFMDEVVKKHSKKRCKESLLESHQKKLKKEKRKKEESGVKQERRPFNREIDLKTNVFDEAQKKSIFKKAQLLDSRFSSGGSKFL